ncbi:WAT1-related protein [Quillaja saponaria]|nr:WAT1-related protein [Quillaja saponaria]
MQSLNDDNSSQAETIDIATCEQPVPKAYPDKDDGPNGYVAHHSYNGFADTASKIDEASRYSGQRFSLTPYLTPRLTPTGTPKVISTTGSPRRYSAVCSPQRTSSTTSPTKHPYEGRTSLSSWYSSSQQSSAANSPPRGRSLSGRTPRIDGKEFFRQARSRLSYEQFSAFLANIKELNAQKQTREETLRKAEEIFGTDNKDLYLLFQGLLKRNVH